MHQRKKEISRYLRHSHRCRDFKLIVLNTFKFCIINVPCHAGTNFQAGISKAFSQQSASGGGTCGFSHGSHGNNQHFFHSFIHEKILTLFWLITHNESHLFIIRLIILKSKFFIYRITIVGSQEIDPAYLMLSSIIHQILHQL